MFDSPDRDEEARLHSIFESYNSKLTPESEWEQIAKDFKGGDYVIQSGDTLWDISRTLFADGFYWPKIWSLNDRIENPHQIEPGYSIRFFEGSFYDAPSVSVVSVATEDEAASTEMSSANGVDELDRKGDDSLQKIFDPRNVVLPPPATVSRPLMKQIPGSLPNMELLARERVEKLGRDLGIRTIKEWPNVTYISSFIVEEDPSSIGTVIETELNLTTASINQIVFVRARSKNDLAKGTVLRTFRRAENLFNKEATKMASYTFAGELEVIERIPSKSLVYRCLVKKSIYPTNIGDSVQIGEVPTADFYLKGPAGTVKADEEVRIVGGEYDDNRRVFAPQSIVFITLGRAGEHREGQLFSIFSDPEGRGLNPLVQEYRKSIGTLKVVKVENNVSTAIIIEASEEIFPGDRVGSYSPVRLDDWGYAQNLIEPLIKDRRIQSSLYP
jgi:hypothetical protein